jgi:hypothetical protein
MCWPTEREWIAAVVAAIVVLVCQLVVGMVWKRRHGVLRTEDGGPPFRKLLRDMVTGPVTPENIRFGKRLIVAWVGGGFLLLLSFFILGFGSLSLYYGWTSASFPWVPLAFLSLFMIALALLIDWWFTLWLNSHPELLKSLGLKFWPVRDLPRPTRRVAKLTANEPDPEEPRWR